MEGLPRYNIWWRQGEDKAINFQLKENGKGKDLTGHKLRMDIHRAGTSATSTFVYTVNSQPEDGPSEVTLDSEGHVEILLPRSLTLTGGPFFDEIVLENFIFVYDMFLRDESDLQEAVFKGKITLERSLTLWN